MVHVNAIFNYFLALTVIVTLVTVGGTWSFDMSDDSDSGVEWLTTEIPITTTEVTVTQIVEDRSVAGSSTERKEVGHLVMEKVRVVVMDKKLPLQLPLNISENTISTGGGQSMNKVDNDDDDWKESWVAPQEIRKNCPYYHSGYDYEGRPIFIAEAGHFNLRKLVLEGGESLKNFDKYVEQAAYRGVQSIKKTNTEDNPVTQVLLIIDFADLNLFQFVHVPTVRHVLNMAREYRSLVAEICHMVLLINVNSVASSFLSLVKPIFGNIFERIEVYGNNKARWVPKLLQHCPKDQIPSWYGGSDKNYKPVQIYG